MPTLASCNGSLRIAGGDETNTASPARRTRAALAGWRARAGAGIALVVHSLSGRLLLLTLLYVLITEVLILVPSLGRYHRSLLEARVESSEIAILPFTEVGENQLSESLRRQLLARAGAEAVMVKRRDVRTLYLNQMPSQIDFTVDLRNQNLFDEMAQALDCMAFGGNRTLRAIAQTRIAGAETIEVVLGEATIRASLVAYAGKLLLLALAISLATALLVFVSLYLVFVRPMGRLTRAMVRFQENPDDAGRIMAPTSRKDEIGLAERGLAAMQRTIYGSLRQRARLAALGAAVAKIQHDLRNMLSTAQLASDRLSSIEDPVVQKLAPRLVSSLGHAVALATNTLRYGRADEQPPQRRHVNLPALVEEVREAAVAAAGRDIAFDAGIDPALEINADPEQLYRILLNLVRNAAEALARTPGARVAVSAERAGSTVSIEVADNGAGIPDALRGRLFEPFALSSPAGGTGLGLAIARDLARAHGGDVALISTGASGTVFRITIPDREEG
ncbi:MAG TPA: HAMP domain-containing sensor histidine kinase [Rhizomicrobium sp.]